MEIKFEAKLLSMVRFEKRVTKRRFLELSEDDREWSYFKNREPRNKYYEILPPVVNPQIKKLREKLKKQKVEFTISDEFINGQLCVVFKT